MLSSVGFVDDFLLMYDCLWQSAFNAAVFIICLCSHPLSNVIAENNIGHLNNKTERNAAVRYTDPF